MSMLVLVVLADRHLDQMHESGVTSPVTFCQPIDSRRANDILLSNGGGATSGALGSAGTAGAGGAAGELQQPPLQRGMSLQAAGSLLQFWDRLAVRAAMTQAQSVLLSPMAVLVSRSLAALVVVEQPVLTLTAVISPAQA